MDLERYERALTFEEYLATVEKNRELWHAVYERVRLPQDLLDAAGSAGDGWRLAVLTEDWCGDAVNTVPPLARFASEVGWDLRVFGRDANPDLMDGHLTNGRSRSIPVVIVYDRDFREVGWWGPRPGEIQSWVMSEGLSLPSPERYKHLRRWYARDRGRTTLEEVLGLLSRAA